MEAAELLAAYRGRVGVLLARGPARFDELGNLAPTMQTLGALQHAHMLAIPFENLDVLLGRPIRIDLDGVCQKLLLGGRGGYCFEHNTLFRAVLDALGFRVTSLAARVKMGLPAGVVPPRTHYCMRVDFADESYLADAGFGGSGPRFPIMLRDGATVSFEGELHRLVKLEDEFQLESFYEGQFAPLYTFSLEPQQPVDYEVANHFTSTHPDSRFRQNLIVQRFTPEGGVVIRNRVFSERTRAGLSQTEIASRAELAELLLRHFDLRVPDLSALRLPQVPEL